MRQKFGLLGAFMLALLAISLFSASCSKNDDPSDNDFFVGTYKGSISYNDGEKSITDDDGRLTVVKVGSSYSFKFGTGIPDINNVKFQQQDDGSYVSVGEGVTGITIDAHSLKMLVSNDDGTWTANCTR
ncbi:hypothetical protein [Compostibacter hankyongensis]|uniref:Lipoprotein n=1 Tax=Compostibacter hankyongensis TaxID=1007089 RepID=A0ABP8G9L0_9BACT